jgi:hypothetical protein
MKRLPVYLLDNTNFRIISVANDQWQYQKLVSKSRGTNYQPATKLHHAQPHFDPWQPQARPTTYAAAYAQLQERSPQGTSRGQMLQAAE